MIQTAFCQDDKKLIIQSDRGVKLLEYPSKIHIILKFNNSVIIMLGNHKPTYGDRNIFRISEDGKVIWQIGQPTPFRNVDRSACFTNLWVDEITGKLKAGSLNDHDYDIDFETGNLSNETFSK